MGRQAARKASASISKRAKRSIAALVSAAVLLGGCAAFDAKQGQWIFNPTDRSWGPAASSAEGFDDAWVEFDSKITGRPTRLHLLVASEDVDHLADPRVAEARAAPRAVPVGKITSVNRAAPTHGGKPVLLYLHGARWNVSGSTWRMQRMRELGFTVVAVDYRGFGKSGDETPSEDKAYEDARAAWDWLAQRFPDRDRFVFGHSLGAAIAIELAAQVSDERGTIVEGGFTSIPDVFSTLRWGWLPVGWLITQRFDAVSKVSSIGSPLLVVHGSDDRVVQPELGQRLYDAAKDPKRFILVKGGSHHNTNGIAQPQYRKALKEMFGLDA